MYDKSKKTWSQRLKITKSEKLTTTSPSTNTTNTFTALNNDNNNKSNSHKLHTSATTSPTTAHFQSTGMHLQQLSDYHISSAMPADISGVSGGSGVGPVIGYDYLPSALSRSMKYAEPWIYSTVRGIPTHGYHHHFHQTSAPTHFIHPHAAAIFAPNPLTANARESLAVVICSCPEYLNGTKRDVKKATVCKKCKGSRLPLTTIGGTMRLPASMAMAPKMRPSGAATVRVMSMSKKSRPTILDPQADPYDLMRRTRLLSPEPGGAPNANDKSRNRGRSSSPQRGRSRTRALLPAPPVPESKKKSQKAENVPDPWMVEDTETLLRDSVLSAKTTRHTRQSILRPQVNPYELISIKNTTENAVLPKTLSRASSTKSTPSKPTIHPHREKQQSSSQNEFMPPSEDFNVANAALNEDVPPFATSRSTANINHATPRTKAYENTVAKQTPKSGIKTNAENGNAVQKAELNATPTKKSYANVQAIAGQRISLGENKMAKKSLIKQSEAGSSYESFLITTQQEAIEKDNKDKKELAEKVDCAAEAETLHQPKRPPRVKKQESVVESKEVEVSASNEIEKKPADNQEEQVTVLTVTPTQNIKSILKRPQTMQRSNSDSAGTPTASETYENVSFSKNIASSMNNGNKDANAIAAGKGTSQFYIPLPQARKKVQFMMEDEAMEAEDNINEELLANQIEANSPTTATINYEYYNRKREEQRLLLQQLQHSPVASPKVVVIENRQHEMSTLSLLVSCATPSSLDSKANSQNNQNIRSINGSYDSVAITSPQHDFDITADMPTTNINNYNKKESLHYEDVDVVPANNNNKSSNNINCDNDSNENNYKIMSNSSTKLFAQQPQQQQQFQNIGTQTTTSSTPASASSSSSSNLLSSSSLSLLSSSTPVSTANADVAAQPATLSTALRLSTIPTTVITTTTTLPSATVKKSLTAALYDDVSFMKQEHKGQHGDYDDVAKQQLQALLEGDSKSSNNVQLEAETTQSQSRIPIRRSHSERQLSSTASLSSSSDTTKNGCKEQNHSSNNDSNRDNKNFSCHKDNGILNFKDTMALRLKSNRNDSRDLFAYGNNNNNNNNLGNMCRPREPPPPPPPYNGTASGSNRNSPTQNPTLSLAAQVQQREGNATVKDSRMSENLKMVANELSSHNQKQQRTNKNQRNSTNNIACGENKDRTSFQEINNRNFSTTGQHQPMTSVSRAFENQEQEHQQLHHSYLSKSQAARETTKPTKTNTTSSPSSNANNSFVTSPATTPQRTVVRVAPFNKTTSEVHRLKISHTDDGGGDINYNYNNQCSNNIQSPSVAHGSISHGDPCTQKKTSILINGDDCYSTMNLSCDASTPLYQSSVVVTDYSPTAKLHETFQFNSPTDSFNETSSAYEGLSMMTTNSNTVTINVSSPRSAAEELIYHHNKINTLLSRQAKTNMNANGGGRAIIPIRGTSEISLQRSASSTSSTSTSSMTSTISSCSSTGGNNEVGCNGSVPKRGRTLIKLDYEKEKMSNKREEPIYEASSAAETGSELLPHEEELLKILRNPVEAVKRNLVPHICGKFEAKCDKDNARNKKMKEVSNNAEEKEKPMKAEELQMPDSPLLRNKKQTPDRHSFISRLLEDPTLSQVADGLEADTIAELIENSLKRLRDSRSSIDISGTKDSDDMNRLINISLQKIKEERLHTKNQSNPQQSNNQLTVPTKEEDHHSNRGSISSANSFASANNYELFDFDANESDCYQSCSSEITSHGDDDTSSAATRSKFYQMLVDATLAEIELSNMEDDADEHHYESIRNNGDPIYEEISDIPPPLPLTAPPTNDSDLDKKATRSIFEGASKYDILSYLVDAKERGLVREESFEYPMNCSNPIIIEEEADDTLSDLGKRKQKKDSISRASILSDSSEDNHSNFSSLSPPPSGFIGLMPPHKGASSEIERNDSGVGSETSKSSRSKYLHPSSAANTQLSLDSPIHLCEDCDGPVETQVSDSGVMFAPLVCRKCNKKRIERKEIITEIVETEEKYGRDLQIVLEEFCHPMLVAGLLTQEQLSAIFLNTEELLENNQTLAERMRDALDIALEQGDDDLLTVNIGKIFLDFTQMLHAFESYCVRQAGSSLLLANLEKEKELLRIFLKVSQMENAVLRRMNLNSFLMVPVQRVTKYPLLLARLYKVTPAHLEGREQLKQAQEKIELHLNHINQEAKDVPTKLWRRISSSSPNRRASCEIDMINIKLRKMAIDILEWNHDEVRFALEGKLLYTQPTDSNWKKARTIKLTPVNALLVTNGKPSANYKAEKVMSDKLNFPKHTGIREASLLVVKEKCGRYSLIREPLYLDRCVVCSEADWDDYFEVQEISSKDTFIFKAEDSVRTKQWYTQLQFHAQGMGAWRKRRNAMANIMINGMLTRS